MGVSIQSGGWEGKPEAYCYWYDFPDTPKQVGPGKHGLSGGKQNGARKQKMGISWLFALGLASTKVIRANVQLIKFVSRKDGGPGGSSFP